MHAHSYISFFLLISGSIDSESGVFAMAFDQSGSRLITCDSDKTIKIYKEDDLAVRDNVTLFLLRSSYCVYDGWVLGYVLTLATPLFYRGKEFR